MKIKVGAYRSKSELLWHHTQSQKPFKYFSFIPNQIVILHIHTTTVISHLQLKSPTPKKKRPSISSTLAPNNQHTPSIQHWQMTKISLLQPPHVTPRHLLPSKNPCARDKEKTKRLFVSGQPSASLKVSSSPSPSYNRFLPGVHIDPGARPRGSVKTPR